MLRARSSVTRVAGCGAGSSYTEPQPSSSLRAVVFSNRAATREASPRPLMACGRDASSMPTAYAGGVATPETRARTVHVLHDPARRAGRHLALAAFGAAPGAVPGRRPGRDTAGAGRPVPAAAAPAHGPAALA